MGYPVMMGLKSFIPKLSKVLEISEIALYERQRALVRAGLLKNVEGRGPGSGVRLTTEALATLLIALLVTPNLSETAAATRLLLNAKRDRRDIEDYKKVRDSLGGAETFKAALAHVLTSDEEITVVRVYRGDGFAVFYLKEGRPHFSSNKKRHTSPLDEIAQIQIAPIRAVLKAALEGDSEPTEIKPKDHRK